MMSNNYKHTDMQTFKYFTQNAMAFYAYGFAALLLTGCQSYKNVPEQDGVYAQTNAVVVAEENNSKNNYYQQYFSAKASQMEELPEENLIFTDISAYNSNESIDEEGYVVIEEPQEEPYAGWGNNSTDITINVYNTGWNDPFYYGGWYRPWGFNYWNRPFWGFNSPWGWNPYWQWNAGFYNPYFYGPGFWPYHNYYGNNWYQNGYNYAHVGNRGRSNQDLLRHQQRPGSRPTRYLTPGRSNRSSATTAGRPVGSRYNRSNVQSQNERPVSVSRRFNPSNRANNNSSVTPRPPQNVKINKRRANNATQTNQTRPANNSTNNRRQNTRPQTFSRPSSGVRSSSSGRGGRGGRGGV